MNDHSSQPSSTPDPEARAPNVEIVDEAFRQRTDLERSRERLRQLADLLDSKFEIPGTGIRYGLDSLIGLVPVVGDIATGLLSAYIVLEARRLGASKWTLARMTTNATLDATIGAVPVAGDVFDVAFKANRRNIALLERHLERKEVKAERRQRVATGEATWWDRFVDRLTGFRRRT